VHARAAGEIAALGAVAGIVIVGAVGGAAPRPGVGLWATIHAWSAVDARRLGIVVEGQTASARERDDGQAGEAMHALMVIDARAPGNFHRPKQIFACVPSASGCGSQVYPSRQSPKPAHDGKHARPAASAHRDPLGQSDPEAQLRAHIPSGNCAPVRQNEPAAQSKLSTHGPPTARPSGPTLFEHASAKSAKSAARNRMAAV
jgi:hypothetical protein